MMKKLLVLSLILTLTPYHVEATYQEDPKAVVLNCFQDVLENVDFTKADFDQYFSKDYIQVSDGKSLNYEQGYAHIQTLKRECRSIKVIIHDIVVQGSRVATRHTAYVTKKDGSQVEVNVMAICKVKDGKLIRCDELTRVVKGNKEDADLGSRY